MSIFTEFKHPDSDDAGISLADFGRALCIWSAMNGGRNVTVSEAAMAFNTTPDYVRAAVAEDYWAFLSPEDEPDPAKQRIEVDGE